MTSSKSVHSFVKEATVAIALFNPNDKSGDCPFEVIGSGFCLHSEGLIATCAHVLLAFFDKTAHERIASGNSENDGKRFELNGAIPHVIFYSPRIVGAELYVFPIPIVNAVSKTDFDLALLKINRHSAFPNGYPTLQIADYEGLHETMEIGTCGFPLGNVLQKELGTITSSFTKGMISSIIPVPNVDKQHLKGFQLDLTATNGNSGGPVFELSTGKVFGVIERGIQHPQTGHIVQGLTKAAPIYPLYENDLINRLLKGLELPK